MTIWTYPRDGSGSGWEVNQEGIEVLDQLSTGLEARTFIACESGISRPPRDNNTAYYDDEIVDYVLGNMSIQEEELMRPAIDRACEAVEFILTEGMTAAMNKFNKL